MAAISVKSLNRPDETRTLPKTKVDVVNLDKSTIMRAAFEPGWKWSECVKPSAGTKSCEHEHLGYVVSGKMKVMMDDGSTQEMGPGDAIEIAPGHDAQVIGNEPCVVIDFLAGKSYGKQK